jgi:pleiotropic regulator 1
VDSSIKLFDLASGKLKLTLTGHVASVRDISISSRHPYLFSCSEDKLMKCWDLEVNKVIRSYYGHFNGVYKLSLHPQLDVVFTGSRDKTVKMWDIRTKNEIKTFLGHNDSVTALASQMNEPTLISGSADTTIKCFDIISGKCITTLTHNNKTIHDILIHPQQYSFSSASANRIKVFNCPDAQFIRNFQTNAHSIDNINIDTLIYNTISMDHSGSNLVAGTNSGHLSFFDYASGYNYDTIYTPPQAGSLIESENSILTSAFDLTGTRLITGANDKTIKFYKQDLNATRSSHPIIYSNHQPNKKLRV